MVKPGLISVGVATGVMLLGGSGIAIPVLWSKANRAESRRDELQVDLREVGNARVEAEEQLADAQRQLAELNKQVELSRQMQVRAEEKERLVTNELAQLQARNREMTAASETLQLRNDEMAELIQELEQAKSDRASLLTQLAAARASNPGRQPDRAADLPDDLVPIPSGQLASAASRDRTSPEVATPKSASREATSRETAKPTKTKPVRFDDRGWKSVAPNSNSTFSSHFPAIDFGAASAVPAIPGSSAPIIVP